MSRARSRTAGGGRQQTGRRVGAAALSLALLAAACGGGEDPNESVAEAECQLDALDEAVESGDGPVEITFWVGMGGLNADTVQQLTDEFNESQDRVRVTQVNNNGDREQQERYAQGRTTDNFPDLVQHENTYLQTLIDGRTVLPMQSCIEAADYDLSDHIPRSVDYYEVDDVQWGLPFNINTPLLYYDGVAFREAGLDPQDPPQTLEELQDYAQALKDSGLEYGMGIKRDGWHMEQWLALQGEPLVDNGNGRNDRATEVQFDNEAGVEIFTVFNDMVQEGLATSNPTEGPTRNANMEGLGAGNFGMTIDSSGGLGIAVSLLEDDQFPDIEPGIAPLPGRTEEGGALMGGGGLFISSDDPARQAAAWVFAEFLNSPHAQSVLAAATGYIPVRQSALEEPEVEQRWSERPEFRVPYDQLLEGAENDATAGAVLGPYFDLRQTMEEVEASMFRGDLTPEEAVEQAAEDLNERIADYNDRLGE